MRSKLCHLILSQGISSTLFGPCFIMQAQELSMIAWAKSSLVLAVGTVKGNLQLYHIRERRRTPIVGKHTKRISSGVWTKGDVLAMAAFDKTVSSISSPADCRSRSQQFLWLVSAYAVVPCLAAAGYRRDTSNCARGSSASKHR
eukprot:GHUV01040712.1.p1 GENE.GHUV01040712.1~~GHUV01040712.1.p1  ORF type:complete len:144 (-),score=14.82 GHUV01040712.1:332-763(-)